MDNLVSIIMPVYNVQNYLAKAIESVLEQTYQNFEIIIVDDGSPDQSYSIAKGYQEQDSRIKVVQKQNGGLSDARNYGLKFCKGEYLYFFDSDDTIESNLLETVVTVAMQHQSDIVYFGYNVIVEDQEQNIISMRKVLPNANHKNQLSIDIENDDSYQLLGYAWNKLYKKAFIDKHNFIFQKGLSLIEDIEFNQRVFKQTYKIIYCNQALYNYIQRPRPTLVSNYYESCFTMQLESLQYRKDLTKYLGYNDQISNQYYKKNLLNGYKFALNNLYYSTKENKKQVLKEIIENPIREELDIQLFSNRVDKLIVYLIKTKNVTLLHSVYSFKCRGDKK